MGRPTSESVLADLRSLPLLSPEQLARVEAAAVKSAPGPEKIVQRLTGKGWITPFQAEVLLAGKSSGLLFGHYILLSRLGEGGMGAVFKARHTRLDRIDAVKVIRADKIASKLVAKRFLREIQLTADLNHPHIIKALDAGQVGSQLYLATEYVPGEDLTATVRREGTLSVADACLVIYQCALALRHIHERGLIHRDLKPSNIMREEKTKIVKLLDLGLSNSLHEQPSADSQAGHLTRDGVMLGTPDFMPPEQARNPHGVDIRADLYSLGCTFFYLLTGRTPYDGSSVEKLLKHTTAPIPPLVLPRGPTPTSLAAIVNRLMAKRPEDRFQEPQELIDALLALRPGSEPGAIPTATATTAVVVDDWQSQFDLLIANDPSASGVNPIPRSSVKPEGKGRAAVWWFTAAAALVALSVSVFFVMKGKSTAEPPVAEAVPAAEESADELKALRAAEKTPGEDRAALRARVLAFRAKNLTTAPGTAAAALLRKLPSPLDLLAAERDDNLTDSSIVRLGEANGTVANFTFSPADDRLIVTRFNQPPEEWELPALQRTNRFASMTVPDNEAATLAADGRTAACVNDGKVQVWADSGMRTTPLDWNVERVAILPDGKTAIVVPADSEERLARVDLETGKVLQRLEHPSGGVTGIAVAPDGASVIVFGPENMIRQLATANGKLQQAYDTPPNVTADAVAGVFGPESQRLYLIGAFRTAGRFAPGSPAPSVVYEVAGEKPNPFLSRTGQQGRPASVAIAADESTVAVGTFNGHLHVYSAATGKAAHHFRFQRTVTALAFSTHGRTLAVALEDGTALLLPLR